MVELSSSSSIAVPLAADVGKALKRLVRVVKVPRTRLLARRAADRVSAADQAEPSAADKPASSRVQSRRCLSAGWSFISITARSCFSSSPGLIDQPCVETCADLPQDARAIREKFVKERRRFMWPLETTLVLHLHVRPEQLLRSRTGGEMLRLASQWPCTVFCCTYG